MVTGEFTIYGGTGLPSLNFAVPLHAQRAMNSG